MVVCRRDHVTLAGHAGGASFSTDSPSRTCRAVDSDAIRLARHGQLDGHPGGWAFADGDITRAILAASGDQPAVGGCRVHAGLGFALASSQLAGFRAIVRQLMACILA